MTLLKWRPLNSFHDLFEEHFNNALKPWRKDDSGVSTLKPAVDIYENEDSVVIKASLPGMKKEDIEVSVENNVMTIRGELKQDDEVNEDNYYKRERYYGLFQRSFTLGEGMAVDQIDANYTDGILKLSIPKIVEEKEEPKKIEIK